ncbi:hypothetical protein G4H71_05335 [Rhodococcus triatomae]|uniref:Uncharacterized protein n=1 Tax=Rhodococcus triatomae TaxID=300028 RepID=A0A1G8AEP7_9NOCA|nr:hypothetical protein [Rhodococcus triatomae]QNG17800.1 hypothetical protein G4H72_02710 [Rhodococcus triatomae]QNG22532.1 hypothetical protein G4H71_05335 [Rhodococcus triatomae]SDH18790.1 hypothetical protein SAMN05444695_101389 [Rhodococcus triatomae]
MSRTALRAAGIVAAAGAAITLAGAGTAAADTEVTMTRCLGLSPYIADQPFAPARLWQSPDGPGAATFTLHDVSSFWFFAGGYQSDVRLDWRNLDTGASGTAHDTRTVAYPGGDSARLHVPSGPGAVELTLSAYNHHDLWGFPTTSCTGTAQVG